MKADEGLREGKKYKFLHTKPNKIITVTGVNYHGITLSGC